MSIDAALAARPTATGRTWLGALGVLVVSGSLHWAAGPLGLLVGSLVAVAWYALPGPYAVAGGHIVTLPVVGDPAIATLVPLEAGFLAVLAAPIARDADLLWQVGLLGVVALGLGAVAWRGWHQWSPRWLVGLAVVALVAVGLYAVHRYAVVALEIEGVEQPP